MKDVLAITLIATGSFLEIYYYKSRFETDGIDDWLSIVIGAALTALLAAATFYREKTAGKILIITLACFSVFATSAGQAFSLGVEINQRQESQVNQENIQDRLDEIVIEITRKNSEYDSLAAQIGNTVTSLEDRYEWKNTLAGAEARQGEIQEEIELLKAERQSLRGEQTTRDDVETAELNIYAFYGDMLDVPARWMQFILQTILSAFIALMAPFGIMMIQEQGEPAKVKQQTDYSQFVKDFIKRNWISVRSHKERPGILSQEYYTRKYQDTSGRAYVALRKAAVLSKCIDRSGNILVIDEAKAIRLTLKALEVISGKASGNGTERSNGIAQIIKRGAAGIAGGVRRIKRRLDQEGGGRKDQDDRSAKRNQVGGPGGVQGE